MVGVKNNPLPVSVSRSAPDAGVVIPLEYSFTPQFVLGRFSYQFIYRSDTALPPRISRPQPSLATHVFVLIRSGLSLVRLDQFLTIAGSRPPLVSGSLPVLFRSFAEVPFLHLLFCTVAQAVNRADAHNTNYPG